MANYVKFGVGSYASYDSDSMAGMIYFAKDTNQIYLNGTAYGYSVADSAKLDASIKSISLNDDQKTLTITKNDDKTETVVLLEVTQAKPGLMSAADKKNLDTLNGEASVEGSVKKQIADAKSDLESKITGATVKSADKTVKVTPSASGTDLSVNIDETTIVKNASTGVLSVAPAATAVSGKDAIKVTTNNGKQVELVIAAANKVLTQSASGLDTTLGLKFVKAADNTADGANKGKAVVQLIGVGDAVIGEFDATDLVMDGVLESVSYDKVNGTITFTWNADAGKTATTVDLKEYIKPYTNGNGLNLTEQTFSVKIKDNDKYLTVDTNGVASKGIDDAIDAAIAEALGGEDAKPVDEQIEEAIEALDSEKTSTDGTNVQVKVTQTDGKIAAVSVTTDNTASKTQLTAEATARKAVTGVNADTYSPKTDANYIQAATSLKDADEKLDAAIKSVSDKVGTTNVGDQIDAKIAELDANVTSTGSSKVTVKVTEEDGKVKTVTVTESDIASDAALTAEIAARKAVDGQNGQTYAAVSGSTFIKNATSLTSADTLLDTALAELAASLTWQEED